MVENKITAPRKTNNTAVTVTHHRRADGPPGLTVGMGWLYQEASGTH